jgi:hypothetical protein
MNTLWLMTVTFLMVFQVHAQATNELVGSPEKELAQRFGISTMEAERRLAIQSHSEDVGGPIVAEFAERLAGAYVRQDPLALVIRLVGDQPVAPRSVATPDGPMTVEFETGARNSLKQLKEVAASPSLQSIFPNLQGIGTDSRIGAVVIFLPRDGTLQAYQEQKSSLEKTLGVPLVFKQVSPVIPL